MFWNFKTSWQSSGAAELDSSPCLPTPTPKQNKCFFGSAYTSVAIDVASDSDVSIQSSQKALTNSAAAAVSLVRSWIVFTCLQTRAVHLELVTTDGQNSGKQSSSLDKNNAIIEAFRRFTKMWAPPEEVHFFTSGDGDDHARLEKLLPMLQAVHKFKLVLNPHQPIWDNFYPLFSKALGRALQSQTESCGDCNKENSAEDNTHHFQSSSSSPAEDSCRQQIVMRKIEELVNSRPLLKHGSSWNSFLTPEHLVAGSPFALVADASKSGKSDFQSASFLSTFQKCWSREYINSLKEYINRKYASHNSAYLPSPGEVILLWSASKGSEAQNLNDTEAHFPIVAVEKIFTLENPGCPLQQKKALVARKDGTTLVVPLESLVPFECTLQSDDLLAGCHQAMAAEDE